MPSEDFDESADPLTAPAWPIAEDAASGGFDPGMQEQVDDSAPRATIPKPPDVGEILRGEYTGWVPVIKAGESLVDAQERAAAKIRRIEAEIEASDIDGAHSVSMWIPYNTGAVPLPPKVTGVPPTTHVTAAVIIPPRPADPQPPAGEFTRMIPDPDQVLSPSDALDEARRRIAQMRQDLESNVALVTRSFEHEFFAVPADDAAPVDDEAEVSVEVAELIANYTPPAPPAPAPRTPRRTLDDIADEIEKAIDANDSRIGEHIVNAGVIRERLRREREAEARAAVARAAAERGPVLPDDVLEALNLSATVDSVNGEPTSGETVDFDPSLEPLNADMPARATLDDVFTVPVVEDPEPGFDLAQDELSEPADIGDLASDIDEELDDDIADIEDEDIADAVIVDVTVVETAAVVDAPVVEVPRVSAPPVTGDSEAKFLGDLLDSLADVEAAVTAVVNSTALDDVLAKYKDILEADTSGATREDVEAAAQVSEMAAATRVDISAMIEGLKAAAETFSDQDASAGVADAAAALEGIFTAPPVMGSAAPAAPEAEVAAPAPPTSVAEEVARMRAAAVAAMHVSPDAEAGESEIDSESAHAETVDEPITQVTAEVEPIDEVTADFVEDIAATETAAHEVTAQDAAEREPVAEQAAQESAPEAEPAVDDPHLVDLVDSALRRVPLPPIFQGEPKRMSAQEQLDSLGGHVPTMVPPRRLPPKRTQPPAATPPSSQPAAAASPAAPAPQVPVAQPVAAAAPPAPAQPPVAPPPAAPTAAPVDETLVPGGRRSDIDEEHEIDRIIAAAAARSDADLADDDEGDDVLTAAEIMGMTPRRARRAPEREQVFESTSEPGMPDELKAPEAEVAEIAGVVEAAPAASESTVEPEPEPIAPVAAAEPLVAEPEAVVVDVPAAEEVVADEPVSQVPAPHAPAAEAPAAHAPGVDAPAPADRTDSVSRRIADESIFNAASASPVAATYVLNEQAAKDHSLELVIMRDEIRDLRDRLDSSQRLIEDLMLRLAQLTEIALRGRMN